MNDEPQQPRRILHMLSQACGTAIASLAMTLLSSCVPRTVELVYPGSTDCHSGCQFVAGGWPFAYVVDAHGLSPSGSADLLGAVLGNDLLRVDQLLMTLVFWAGVHLALTFARRRRSMAKAA
ncbi:hypothetical protein J2X16_000852 [Pelomonas aquatica]|uniref:Uncharacterized protein n=1 Tax=Pelomonas aquatica TaxID=431058 RepID=A0ABU1Z6A2_9BURK|nr:hypothetical protein [Pelomonas aquatica]MDR7295531.1 hypothetical protein [Pelomonas aquatica]